jgi:phage N-6-adenine-methyltransferase
VVVDGAAVSPVAVLADDAVAGREVMNTGVLFSKASDEWATPSALFQELDAEFGFALDAAARPENTKCRTWFGPGGAVADALAVRWTDYLSGSSRAVFLNPPYSRCRDFITTAAASAQQGLLVVALVPARTDTRWWHDHIWDHRHHDWRPDVRVRFLKGRLRFGTEQNSAPFPSAIVMFGR